MSQERPGVVQVGSALLEQDGYGRTAQGTGGITDTGLRFFSSHPLNLVKLLAPSKNVNLPA